MPDYGKILNKSIETTKKFKWLWVYGLGLAATTAGSASFNFPSGNSGGGSTRNFDNDSLDKLFNSQKNLNIPQTTPKEVLGAFTNTFTDWLSHVSPQTWSLLALGIILSILAGMAISWVLSSWLNGSLIAGLKLAHKDEEVTLKNTSPLGISKIKDLIVLRIIQFVAVLACTAAAIVIVLVLTMIVTLALKDIAPLLIILLGIGLFFLAIQFGITNVLAERAVVLDNLSAWEAWSKAWKLTLENYFPSILFGIISSISATAFGCITNIILLVILGIPAVIFIVPMVSNNGNFHLSSYWVNILVLVILLVAFSAANLLIRALTVVFSASNWNLWFEEVSKKGKIK